jgi:uncharacterized MAPEG superfamily protein
MVFVQAMVASIAHRQQKEYVPGVVDEQLGPESFVFRSHRTFMNSIENVPFMFGLSMVSILSGFSAVTLCYILWGYVFGRLGHMFLYYKIATRKNPSARSYFFMISILAQLILFVLLGLHLMRG